MLLKRLEINGNIIYANYCYIFGLNKKYIIYGARAKKIPFKDIRLSLYGRVLDMLIVKFMRKTLCHDRYYHPLHIGHAERDRNRHSADC